MNPALSYIYARLSEPSTWRGIIALVTAAVVALSPDQMDKIIAAGLPPDGTRVIFHSREAF